jgi:hypothetical protein
MKKTSRVFLFGALVLVLVLAGCAGEEGTVTPFEPGQETSVPTMDETAAVGTAETQTTGTAETAAAGTAETETTPTVASTQEATEATIPTATAQAGGQIPVTGGDINVIECQFCLGTMAYALLDIPAVATFEIAEPASADPDIQCNVVDTLDDRQVIFCRAPEQTSVTVNVCTDASTCSQATVDLQACPLATGATATSTPGAAGTATATGGTPEASPTAGGATATPTP